MAAFQVRLVAAAVLFTLAGCSGTNAESDPSSVTILLGNGDGTFRRKADYSAGYPVAGTLGDFNNDGLLDLALANQGGVALLLGKGDGSFRALKQVRGPSGTGGARTLTAADFNRDGTLDLAVGFYDLGIVVLLGDGDGTFSRMDIAPIRSTSIVAADFNLDGVIDLAVAGFESGNITVLAGAGDGSFATAAQLPVPVASSVGVDDLNNDGRLDLVAGSYGGSVSDPTVNVFLGVGDGTFEAARRSGHAAVLFLALADLNRDNKIDAVTSGGGDALFLGDGSGGFGQELDLYPFGNSATVFGVGDFNGDGKPDLVGAHSNPVTGDCATPCGVGVLLGHGDGTFDPEELYGAGYQPWGIVIGDLDGDAIEDIIVVNSAGNGGLL